MSIRFILATKSQKVDIVRNFQLLKRVHYIEQKGKIKYDYRQYRLREYYISLIGILQYYEYLHGNVCY